MGTPHTGYCALGRDPTACCVTDIAAMLPQGIGGNARKRRCPVHDDTHASLSINPGKDGQRIVWHCHSGCDPGDIRAALLALGVDESCLGHYGIPKEYRTVVPGMRVPEHAHAPGMVADAKRWQAMLKLKPGLNGKLRQMCIQAIAEGDGDLPGDPDRLLPVTREDFVALAARAGIARAYRYKLFEDRCRGDF